MNKLALAAGAWLGGILLGTLAGVDPAVAALLLLAALLAAVALRLGRWPALPAILTALLLLGAVRGDAVRLEPLPEELFGRQVFIEGEIASHPETTARRMRFEVEISRMSRETPPAVVRQLTEADAGIYAQSDGPSVMVLVHPDGAGDGFDAETPGRSDADGGGSSVNIIPRPATGAGDAAAGAAAMVTGGRVLLYSDLPPPESDSSDSDSTPSYSYGDHLLIHGLLLRPEPIGDFDYPAYLASRGIGGVAISLGGLRLERRPLFPWRSWLHRLRDGLSQSLEAAMPFPSSALGQAMLLGQRQTLPPELTEQFRSAGAAHLLAISGLHIGILLALTAGAAGGLLGRRRGWYLLLPLAAVWGYALLAGATPSVVRAAIMGSVYLAALAAGRPGSGLPALALAAAVMTALSPEILLRAGFQLSFAAVAGIFIAQAMLGRWTASRGGAGGGWRRLALRPVAALALISAAATLATWPLVAWHFGTVALWGVPASLLAIPAMPAVVVGTGAAAFGGLLHPALGEFLGWLAAAPAAYVIAAVSLFPDYTLNTGALDGWGPALVIGWYGALAALLLAGPPVRWRRWGAALRDWADGWRAELAGARPFRLLPILTLAAGTAVAAAILWTMAMGGGGSGDGRLRVHFFDVGQGDAALIVTPGGRQLLIDGGPEAEGAARALARTLPGGDRSLDLVALTHLDADHSRGLLETLDRYRVGAVLEGLRPPEASMLPQWAARLERHNLQSIPLRAGHAIELEPGLTLETLNPPMLPANAGANTNITGRDSGNNSATGDDAYAAGNLDANNGGVVLRLEYGAVSILLAADIEAETEERLLREGVLQPSTLLKVPHHGSNTSTTAAFLEAVAPQAAIVSVGAGNPYGHPSPAVMERLAARLDASRIFRTDQHGDITLTTDGQTLQIATQR